jgi:hypothetical protein
MKNDNAILLLINVKWTDKFTYEMRVENTKIVHFTLIFEHMYTVMYT